MRVLDLFSGIGGFSIGLEKVGFETVAFCEIEPYCQAVLRKHWPDTPIYNDVRSLTGEQLRADGLVWPDVIVGGYPCQPFSVAGVRRGEEDDRHLWPEVRRLIAEIRPTWCILENVAGHISMGLDEVLSELEDEDYAARPFVIPACGVDAPHRRDRVWIVAHSNRSADRRASRQNEGTDGEVPQRDIGGVADQSGEVCTANVGDAKHDGLSAAEVRGKPKEASGRPPQGAGQAQQSSGTSRREDDGVVAYAKSEQGSPDNHGREQGTVGQSEQGQFGGSHRGTHEGFWPTEPNVGRVANGVPNRSHRIKALGNAVVPQIPEMIGLTIMRYENAQV